MNIHAEPVTRAVHIEFLIATRGIRLVFEVVALFNQFINIAFKQSHSHHTFSQHSHRAVVRLDECSSGLHRFNRFELCVKNELINLSLRFGEDAARRPGARHVACEVAELRARIDQQQVIGGNRAVVRHIMQHGGVCARRNNRRVAVSRASLPAKDVTQRRFDFVFVHPRTQRPQRRHVAVASNLDGATQQGQIIVGFNQAHLVENVCRVNHRSRADAIALALALKTAHQADESFIECRIAAEAVINPLCLSKQLRQLFVELINRERRVRAVVALCAFFASAPARPHFALAVFRLHKQREAMFRVIGHQHGNGVRLFKTCQVIKVCILPVFVLDIIITNGRRRSRKDSRAARDARHQSFAPFFRSLHHRFHFGF